MNFKNVTNTDITVCLLCEDGVNPSNNVLEAKVKFLPSYTNSHFFLMQYFDNFFSFMPTHVYFNNQYVLYFLPMKKIRMINAKYASKKTAFLQKFSKDIHFINYNEPVILISLIKNLFQHVRFHFLEYKIEENTNLISIYCYAKEYQLKFCLGRKGKYINTINDLFRTNLDQRITIYIRSIGV